MKHETTEKKRRGEGREGRGVYEAELTRQLSHRGWRTGGKERGERNGCNALLIQSGIKETQEKNPLLWREG